MDDLPIPPIAFRTDGEQVFRLQEGLILSPFLCLLVGLHHLIGILLFFQVSGSLHCVSALEVGGRWLLIVGYRWMVWL